VAGFGGRGFTNDPPKYLNSPESPVYKKSRALFGLPQALDAIRERGRAIVVEGYFDLLALHLAGLAEGVAPCGTALTPTHARRLRRYAAEVVLLFDGDAAGQTAAERALPILLAEGLRVRAAFLPLGEDPDTLVAKSGVAALRACVESAVPLLDHLIERALKEAGDNAWSKSDAAKSVAPYLRAIGDPVEREHYERRLASGLQLTPAAIDQAVRQVAEREREPQQAAPAPRPAPTPMRVDPAVAALIRALAAHPEILPQLEALDVAWLPRGAGAELLAQLRDATASRGRNAAATLLSPESDVLDAAQKALLWQLCNDDAPEDAKSAERAASDCIARLEIAALNTAKRALDERRGSCTDRAAQNEIDEELQRIASRRHDLQKRVRQV